MTNTKEEKPSEPKKSSPNALDQNNIHIYPDWATMQAYCGPRFAVSPYLNSVVASAHAPHPCMWGSLQSMIPPYGAPYAGFYAHGGIYARPGVPSAGSVLSMDTHVNSSGHIEGGFMRKLREFEGLAMSIGNGNGDRELSRSEDTEGSSNGSYGKTAGAGQSGKKRSRLGAPNIIEDGKAQKPSNKIPAAEVGQYLEKVIDPPSNIQSKSMAEMKTALEHNNSSDSNVKSSSIDTQQPSKPNEAWLQNDQELKRERRKQSNRESARRSRLRKQAESEELAMTVQSLSSENMTLKTELNKLIKNSEKLKLENATLTEKIKNAQPGEQGELSLCKFDNLKPTAVGSVNLLARVSNPDSTNEQNEYADLYMNNTPGAKLHQLLDNSTITDAVAAG